MKREIASDIRAILHSPNQEEADRLLQKAIQKYHKTAPELAVWMETSIPEPAEKEPTISPIISGYSAIFYAACIAVQEWSILQPVRYRLGTK